MAKHHTASDEAPRWRSTGRDGGPCKTVRKEIAKSQSPKENGSTHASHTKTHTQRATLKGASRSIFLHFVSEATCLLTRPRPSATLQRRFSDLSLLSSFSGGFSMEMFAVSFARAPHYSLLGLIQQPACEAIQSLLTASSWPCR